MPKMRENEFKFLTKFSLEEYDKSIRTTFEEYIPKSKLKILCNKCGHDYEMTINHFKRTYKCPKCEMKKSKDFGRITKEDFIQDAIKIHGNKYDYSLVEYNGTDTKVKIKCLKHNTVFEQTPHKHKSGSGCRKCGYETVSSKRQDTKEVFIEKSNEVHSKKYDYSQVNYSGAREDVDIICSKHGIFSQKPRDHIQGCGCSKCGCVGPSIPEQEVAGFVSELLLGKKITQKKENTKNSEDTKKCLLCDKEYIGLRAFATHLQTNHNLSTKEYTFRHILNLDNEPKCSYEDCKNDVRYVRFGFKKYCKEHSKCAMSIGGRKGGLAEAWNKNNTKETDPRIAIAAKNQCGTSNPFYGKKHTQESLNKMKASSLLTKNEFLQRANSRLTDFEVLTTFDEYYSRQHQYLKVKCQVCSEEEEKTLQAFERGSLCRTCNPASSKPELEVSDFTLDLLSNNSQLQVLLNDRTLIYPKELDIYIPERKFAIEFDGLYWHSEVFIRESKSHLNKTLSCLEKGVQLFHIFSDEWDNKQDIVKSMIRHRLGMTEIKIGARECEVKEISQKESSVFFENNHISGNAPRSKSFGLFYKGELVSCITARKPEKYPGNAIEIARFASKLNTLVSGGFEKLLKPFKEYAISEGCDEILTYADRRFGEGKTYSKVGFEQLKSSGVNYYYTDFITRWDRRKFRAQKEVPEKGIPKLTEKQVADNAGVKKIYDCGSNRYLLKL